MNGQEVEEKFRDIDRRMATDQKTLSEPRECNRLPRGKLIEKEERVIKGETERRRLRRRGWRV